MKTLRRLSCLAGMLLLPSLFAPLGADARPLPAGSLAPLSSLLMPLPSVVGAHLIMSRLSSAPQHARAGHVYVLHGSVVNDGSDAARGPVVVHLLRVGTRPLAIGRTVVRLAAHESTDIGVRIRLPSGLDEGSYALVACVRRAGRSGELECVTAERHLQIGPRSRIRAARVSAAAPKAACSSRAHYLSPLGAHGH